MVDTREYSHRLNFILIFFFVFLSLLAVKLIYLQVFRHDYYLAQALNDHQGYTELQSRRGEIFIKDFNTNQDFRVATNITLDTVFADPMLIRDPIFVADKISPILFDEKLALESEENRLKEQRKELPAALSEEEVKSILKPRSGEELRLEFRNEIVTKMSQKVRQSIVLYNDPKESLRAKIRALQLPGIEVTDKQIIAYPPQINDVKGYATKLAGLLEINVSRLKNLFEGKNRYVVIATKVEPRSSEKLREMIAHEKDAYKGIGFEERSYRFYPEKELGSQVLGFVDSEGGKYGVEEYYDDILAGEAGVFKTQLDGLGNQITVGDDTVIKPPTDGASVYLTIERSIQMEAEKLISEAVLESQSDSGQLVVMDPKTGNVLALAHYPTFDPNEFWKALNTEEIFIKDEDKEKILTIARNAGDEHYFVEDEDTDLKYLIFPVKSEKTGEVYYEKFSNKVGSAVYRNRTITDTYEPGSIFKPLVMGAALDGDIVHPNDTFNDVAPLYVDEFIIKNAQNKHYGLITMTQVLETSNNIGMSWIAEQMGRSYFASYLKKFGFSKKTDIQQVGESSGYIEPYTQWADSELMTHAFGQGVSITPIQMITGFCALANDGLLMAPQLVDKIVKSDGVVDQIEPIIVRRVVSKKTADTVSAMLVSVVEKGQAKLAVIKGYSVGGKTGTAQTYKNGVPLEGPGTTIASFIGMAPASDPRFVIMVKLDKPRTSPWGSNVSAPTFRKMAEYILRYMNIPPDSI